MNKAVIIVLTLILVMGLGGCIIINPPASTAPALTPPASTDPALTLPPIPAGECLIADSFNLARFDKETFERKYSETPPFQFPFNEFGMYMSKYFWINANQTLDITLMSDYPVAFEGGEQLSWGLYGQISQVEPIRLSFESWVKSHEFRQAGNMWETRVKFSPDKTGWYQLCITNESGKDSRCSYCVALAPGAKTADVAPVVGKVAPEFTLTYLDGKTVSLSSLRGKPVLINFWATWCVPCAEEMPYFQEVYDKWTPKGLVFLSIDTGETATKARGYMDRFGYTFPVLLDTKGDVTLRYGVKYLPTTFIIDQAGVIKFIKIGSFYNLAELEEELRLNIADLK